MAACLAEEMRKAAVKEFTGAPDGKDFSPPNKPKESWLAGRDARILADTVLSYQSPCGGWSKHVDYTKGPRKPGTHWSSQGSPASPWHYAATFDNNSTTGQIQFLLAYWLVSRREEVKLAILRGLDYILASQFPNGGWPQVYPLEGGYHDNITLNDNMTVMILRTLQELTRAGAGTGLLDEERMMRARAACQRGLDLLLILQVEQAGVPTVWCAQYDPLSLVPASARLKEPAALSGGESVGVVEFLMAWPGQPARVRGAIEHALAWFGHSVITGLRKTHRDGRTWYDPDPAATDRLWARFYDIKNNTPLFPGAEDGVIYPTYNAMQDRNKASYAFYLDDAAELLGKKQVKWRKSLEHNNASPP